MNNIEFKLINLAYVFAKFFLLLFWIYLSWLIWCGGEVKITIGDSGLVIGYEGILPSIKKLIQFIMRK